MMKQQVHPQILVIQKISAVLIHGRDVETMLEKVLEIIDSEMGMRRGAFVLRYGDTLQIETSHGLTEAARKKGMYHLGEGIVGHVAATGQSLVIPDLRKDPRFLNRTGSHSYKEPTAFVCVPLIHHEQVIGTLSVDRPITPETDLDSDVAFLEILANITADSASECILLHREKQTLRDENEKLPGRAVIFPDLRRALPGTSAGPPCSWRRWRGRPRRS